ncbi:MAG: CvpA family protein [bacterium]
MNGIDVALVILLLLCGLRGSWRGVFRESFGFAALLIGIWAALHGASIGAAWLAGRMPAADTNPTAMLGVGFVAAFLLASTLINLVGVACDQVFGRGPLGIVSRLAGALFALAKGAAVAAVVLLFLQLFPIVKGLDRQILDSRIARPLVSTAESALRSGWRDGAATDRQA